jgi:hypothetical protein
MPRYFIECEVSGGITGHRIGMLKAHGELVEFATLEAAVAEARRLDAAHNTPHAVASFRYRVIINHDVPNQERNDS